MVTVTMQPLHYVGSDCRQATDWTPAFLSLPIGFYRMLMAFSLWWCLVDGVQGGTISGLHFRASTNQRSGLTLRRYGKRVRVSARSHRGGRGLGETNSMFCFF